MRTKTFLCAIALVGCFSCSNENSVINYVDDSETVTLNFSQAMDVAITRTDVAISTLVSHLDVWIIDGDNIQEVHQSSTDDGFGSVAVSLNKKKTYTIYAMAHKCTSDATLEDGVISFPDDKITHSLWYTTTFSPATTTNLSCSMSRIVAGLSVTTTDAFPESVKKMRVTVFDTTNRWNVAGYGTNAVDKVSVINISSLKPDGTASFITYIIATDVEAVYDMKIEALDAEDNIIESRDFTDIPMRNNYKTSLTGDFFVTTGTAFTLTAGEWENYDPIEF